VYLVVAWIAVQAASIALPAFDAPAWVLRVVILLIALGFPFALVLSWALDVTPEGLRFSAGSAGNKRIALVATALVLLALVWYFRGQPAWRPDAAPANTQSMATAAPAAAEAASSRSIAVLPFVNMSNDPANDYFSDGLAETTLDMLAQVPDMKVVARTSSFAFKGQAIDVRKIGAALGATTLLEGSVQRYGDAVRITTQLVKTSDGTHLWSKHFDRQLADVFKIQDDSRDRSRSRSGSFAAGKRPAASDPETHRERGGLSGVLERHHADAGPQSRRDARGRPAF
jgi:TolB-like protein